MEPLPLCFLACPVLAGKALIGDNDSILFFQLQLQRNEVIALVNLLNRLSESVDFVRKMAPQIDKLMAAGQGSSPASRSVSQ